MNPDIHNLTGAFVLDALNDAERAAFARHLDNCPTCHAEVTHLRSVAARLATAVAPVSAPSLKDRVLADLSTRRQLPADTLGRTQIIPAIGDLERTAIMPPLEGLTDNDFPPKSKRRWTPFRKRRSR